MSENYFYIGVGGLYVKHSGCATFLKPINFILKGGSLLSRDILVTGVEISDRYKLTKFHEKRLHGSARTAIFGGRRRRRRRRRRKEEYKYNKGPSPLRGLLGPLNIAASSDKTGPSKKTMSNKNNMHKRAIEACEGRT